MQVFFADLNCRIRRKRFILSGLLAVVSWVGGTHATALTPQERDATNMIDSAEANAAEVFSADEETVAKADYDALLERIEAIETNFSDYRTGLDEAAEKAEKAAAKKSFWKMGGRVHLDNWNFTDSDEEIDQLETSNGPDDTFDRWEFRRARLEFSGSVPNNMIFRLQLEVGDPNDAEFRDLYIGFTNLPHNQTLLIGNQKRPIGLDHLNSSRFNFFLERPFAVEAFNEDARRFGIAMYGHSDDLSVNWRYGVYKLENAQDTGEILEDFEQGGLYGRLAASPWYDDVSGGRGYLHTAVSGSVNVASDGDVAGGQNDTRFRTRPEARSSDRWLSTGFIDGATDYQQVGLEGILNVGSFQITGEYLFNPVQREPRGAFGGEDLFFHGGYVYATYYLTGEHLPYDRKSGTLGRLVPHENFFLVDRLKGGTGRGWGALGLGLRYSYIDLTDDDIAGGVGNSIALGLNWHWTAYSRLQANMLWGDIQSGGQEVNGVPRTAANELSGQYSILGFRYAIDF